MLGFTQITISNGRDFTHQVIVGRTPLGIAALGIPDRKIRRLEHGLPFLVFEDAGIADHVDRPHPVDQPHTDLESALPVHAVAEWILFEPVHENVNDLAGVSPVTGHPVGSRQQHQLVMPIGLPYELAVAGGIEDTIVDEMRQLHTVNGFPGRPVPLPVDRVAKKLVFQVEVRQPVLERHVGRIEQPVIPFAEPGAITDFTRHGYRR